MIDAGFHEQVLQFPHRDVLLTSQHFLFHLFYILFTLNDTFSVAERHIGTGILLPPPVSEAPLLVILRPIQVRIIHPWRSEENSHKLRPLRRLIIRHIQKLSAGQFKPVQMTVLKPEGRKNHIVDGIEGHIPRNQDIPGYGVTILYIPVALQHPRFLGTVFIIRNGNRPSIIRRIHIFRMLPHQFQVKPYHIEAKSAPELLLHLFPIHQSYRQFPQAHHARILFHVTHRTPLRLSSFQLLFPRHVIIQYTAQITPLILHFV